MGHPAGSAEGVVTMATQEDPRQTDSDLPNPPDAGDDDNIGRFSRRNLLRWLIGLSTGAFAVAFGVPAFAIKALQTTVREIAAGDVLVYATAASGAAAGDPVKASDIQVGTSVQAFPQGKTDNQQNLVELVRVAPGQGKDGLVAYSAICTHLGCVVYAKLNDAGQIACPCHASRFDPAQNAAVVGGPAPRPLPGLPIDVQQDGTVTAAGSFNGPIGVAS
jgi:rieske iron-sulfur protein